MYFKTPTHILTVLPKVYHVRLAPRKSTLVKQELTVSFKIGWIICGSLALVAVITSFWLISKHLQWYTNVRYHHSPKD